MEPLDIAQRIKIIRANSLSIPVYRAPSEDYDIDRPTKFDRHVGREDVQVNAVIGYLIKTIRYLSRELILSDGVKGRDLWVRLSEIKKMLKSQENTQPQYYRRR